MPRYLREKEMTRSVSSLVVKALAPDIKFISPWRDDKWQMNSPEKSRSHTAEAERKIDLPHSGTEQSYSHHDNLWHMGRVETDLGVVSHNLPATIVLLCRHRMCVMTTTLSQS